MEKEKIIKILEENNEGLKSQEIADKSRIDKKIVDKEKEVLVPKIENLLDVYDLLQTPEEKNETRGGNFKMKTDLVIFCAISTITPGRLLQTHLCRSFLYQVAALHKDPVPSYVLVILFLPSGNFHQ